MKLKEGMESKLFIFDLDGTLIDSRGDLTAAINHMRIHYGLEPLTQDVVCSYIGNGVYKLVERALQGAAVDVDEAVQVNLDYYCKNMTTHTYLYEGVKEGIATLVDAGHKVAVLTNKTGEPSREILDFFELSPFFCAVIGGGDVPNLKPKPDGVFKCMDVAGVDKDRVWMIGDHYTDLAVAENADVKSGFAQYGFGEDRGHKVDEHFASFSALVEYFV